jgi:hypothetical protein
MNVQPQVIVDSATGTELHLLRERRQPLLLGELEAGAVVWHPYWKLGRVVQNTEREVWTMFYVEGPANPQTGRPTSVGKLRPLSHTEKVWVWQTGGAQ